MFGVPVLKGDFFNYRQTKKNYGKAVIVALYFKGDNAHRRL